MENIEMNEAVTPEMVEEIKDVVPTWKPDGKSIIIGSAMAYVAIAIGKYAIQPLFGKIMGHVADRKAAKKAKTAKPAEPQVVEVNLEEDLKIDDEEEES